MAEPPRPPESPVSPKCWNCGAPQDPKCSDCGATLMPWWFTRFKDGAAVCPECSDRRIELAREAVRAMNGGAP